jgi:poly(hydroxyalkanoate) depolymerase family esterase
MLRLLLICFFIGFKLFSQTGWNAVSSFGSNPGNLAMYSYAPVSLPANAPLVIVMHGCTQSAAQYASESGWNVLADQHQFYTVYPEQNSTNNNSKCFNWFLYGDQNRGQGEAASIKQMLDYMKTHFSIDTNKIYVTGLSAGACMTNVMMASYPEVFKKGAVMAGTPFKSATSALTASNAMYGFVTHTASQWGDSVRHQNPSYSGPFPKVAIFQGGSDLVVNINNVAEEVKQWTNVHNTDQTADLTQTNFNGNSLVTKTSYYNSSNQSVVETYTISGMGHAIAIDPGTCYQQGGVAGTYASDVNLFSSFWAAYFFNILQSPSSITGNINVLNSAAGVIYSVPALSGNTYTWTVPAGATIVSGQGTNAIIVNFGSTSGNISLTETDLSSCKIGPINLWVNVGTTIVHSINEKNDVQLFFAQQDQSINIKTTEQHIIKNLKLYSINGQLIQTWANIESKTFIENKLESGIYILECEVDQTPIRKKIKID